MGFLFPFFLVAGIALLIPILIHLFNLRRYKHVLFPNIRFLRQLQVASKRTAKIQKKWLLLTRLLFLAALVTAFAQPYFKTGQTAGNAGAVQVIYLDNSLSMTAKKDMESLLQKAKNRARQLINASNRNARFLILSNDKMAATRPLTAPAALDMIRAIKPTAQIVDINRILGSIAAAQENDPNELWRVYLFSDFQKTTFLPKRKWREKLDQTTFFLFPFQSEKLSNLYIDTAYFVNPAMEKGQEHQMVIKVKTSGSAKPESSSLQVYIGGQTRAVREITGFKNALWTDTINLHLDPGWKKITLALKDVSLNFDDTFRLTMQADPNLSVLVVGEKAVNPYLQSAFSSYKGFRMTWEPAPGLKPENWGQYSLVVLQNLDVIPDILKKKVKEKLENGGSVLLFPGTSPNKTALNAALSYWGNIHFGALDTNKEQIVTLQEHQPVLQGLFEKIPENIQLPATRSRFFMEADVTANQQSIMSFRDGSPFLAQYTPEKGRLFIVASPLDVRASNFALSYFFVPVLYKMAVQDQGQNPPSIAVGSESPVWVSGAGNANKRSVWHLKAPSFDAVPAQDPSGAGTNIFVGKAAPQAGFYLLKQEEGTDSLLIALNTNPEESIVDYASERSVEQSMAPLKMHWMEEKGMRNNGWNAAPEPFPLWKICVLIALLCLALETYLLLAKNYLSGSGKQSGWFKDKAVKDVSNS